MVLHKNKSMNEFKFSHDLDIAWIYPKTVPFSYSYHLPGRTLIFPWFIQQRFFILRDRQSFPPTLLNVHPICSQNILQPHRRTNTCIGCLAADIFSNYVHAISCVTCNWWHIKDLIITWHSQFFFCFWVVVFEVPLPKLTRNRHFTFKTCPEASQFQTLPPYSISCLCLNGTDMISLCQDFKIWMDRRALFCARQKFDRTK